MNALASFISVGINAYNLYKTQTAPTGPTPAERFAGLEVSTSSKIKQYKVSSNSNYYDPIEKGQNRIQGFSRGWGQANANTQYQVMAKILEHSSHLSHEDQAILLGIARIESGFNPDAAATSTSASGVFQFVKDTASALGLAQDQVFDAEQNILAGVQLFEENSNWVKRNYPNLSGNERAVKIYAVHHDGPSLAYGGEEIARSNLLPFLDKFRAVVS